MTFWDFVQTDGAAGVAFFAFCAFCVWRFTR